MKMPFRLLGNNTPRPIKRTARRSLRFVVILLLAFALLAAAGRWAPHALATPVQAIARPFIIVRNAIGESIVSTVSFFQSKAAIEAQNATLQKELILYNAVVAERDYFAGQTADLQKLLGSAGSSTPSKFAIARILSKPNFSPYDTMLVAASDSINIGDLVFADPHTIIGYVSAVSKTAVTVTAYSTPGQNTKVLIGSSSIEAVATGLGGGTLEVRLPRNAPVAIGDLVTAAGISDIGILGRVEVATATPSAPFERVLFTSPLDIFDLSYVLIKLDVPTIHDFIKK